MHEACFSTPEIQHGATGRLLLKMHSWVLQAVLHLMAALGNLIIVAESSVVPGAASLKCLEGCSSSSRRRWAVADLNASLEAPAPPGSALTATTRRVVFVKSNDLGSALLRSAMHANTINEVAAEGLARGEVPSWVAVSANLHDLKSLSSSTEGVDRYVLVKMKATMLAVKWCQARHAIVFFFTCSITLSSSPISGSCPQLLHSRRGTT